MSIANRLPHAALTLLLLLTIICASKLDSSRPLAESNLNGVFLLRDCRESNETQGKVETSRGNKAGESMGFAVKVYECRDSTTEPGDEHMEDVRGLPWQMTDPPGTSSIDSNAAPEPLAPNSQECQWYAIPPPPPGDPRWEGNNPTTGAVIANDCNGPTIYRFMAGPDIGGAPAPPPPSPQELAEQAYREILIPTPQIGAGPDREKLAVNLWTWLWVDEPGPQTVTVAAGGVSVTAVATLTSVTWSLGEPAATGGPYATGPPVTKTCQGTGAAPPADYNWKVEPPCGYRYTWMSTADRTGGTGEWPITATTNWTVTWQSNTGVSGSGVLNATGADALEIGEYRVVLVQGAGG